MRSYIYSDRALDERIKALQAEGCKVVKDAPSQPYWTIYDKNYKTFIEKMNVDGYCEVVPMWYLDESRKDAEENAYCTYSYVGDALHVLFTDDYYFILPAYNNKGKYRLYDGRTNGLPLKYFSIELQQPNAIGAPSRKKIEDWVFYWRKYTAEAQAYVDRNEATLKAQETALLHNYPDAQIRRDEDGTIYEIRFKEGNLNYTYERGETGFTRSYKTDYWAVPSFESQTTIREKKQDPIAEAVSKAIARLEELTLKDGLSDVPHYLLDEAITDVYDILTECRDTINRKA